MDGTDNPNTLNRGGMNPLLMMGLGLMASGAEGKGFSQGLLGGAQAAQGFDQNRISEMNAERGWAIKQRELQRQQQADELVKGLPQNADIAKIVPPEILMAASKMPVPVADSRFST